MEKKKRSLRKVEGLGPFIMFVALFIILIMVNSNFLSVMNLRNVLRQASFNGIIAIGMMFVILTGGIDLSVGSVVALAGGFAAKLLPVAPLPVVIVIPILVGSVCGLCNGLLVAKLKMAPFIATLSTMMGVRSLAHLFIGSTSIPISRDEELFLSLSSTNFLGIPLPAIIMFVIIVAAAFMLKYTSFGRGLYSVGGNEEASGMMGLNPARIKIIAYVLSGTLSGLTGVLLTARLGSALNTAGQTFEMTAISTVVLGGVLLTGGRGKIAGVFWAILTMGLFTNLFNMMSNSSIWLENIIMGILLIIIVLVQSGRNSDFIQRILRTIRSQKSSC